MATAVQSNSNKQSSFLKVQDFLKENNKDVLKTIRYTFEWIKFFFANLNDTTSIKNIIRFTKSGEDVLCFNDFAQSVFKMCDKIITVFTNFKMCDEVTIKFIKDTIKTAWDLTRNILDLSWSFFKVCESLQNYKIINFASRFFADLTAFGGISCAIKSTDEAIINIKKLYDLENNKEGILCSLAKNIGKVAIKTLLYTKILSTDKAFSISKILHLENNKDERILYHLYILAKNIGTCALGIIIAAKVFISITPSAPLMLVLGTVILICSISANIIKKTYGFEN